jgi:tRNA 2-thiouridine synthesizing protein A
MKKNLDMRGYSCPIPLLRTRDALLTCDDLTVQIDEPAARENILKFAASQNYKAECINGNREWTLHILKS